MIIKDRMMMTTDNCISFFLPNCIICLAFPNHRFCTQYSCTQHSFRFMKGLNIWTFLWEKKLFRINNDWQEPSFHRNIRFLQVTGYNNSHDQELLLHHKICCVTDQTLSKTKYLSNAGSSCQIGCFGKWMLNWNC